ncbi:hypothetical protein INT48_006010 [Thamnidium elegans]|uniref:Uncharacterized protein n=1 Tax=Thamnidium elegans TaxID=101142 RepID=A0A8H7STH3_9FUNG|nr:hypothetical protein INT48_006010 [Thamnidium elegans]
MQTMQSLLILDQKRNAITSTITNFLTTLDQALTDADLNQEDMMTPFVLGSLNARNGVEEERQQWSKLDYFSNGLIHPPVVKSKSNLYYHLPLYNNNNYSNNVFQNSWRAQPQTQTQTPAELLLNQTQTSDIAALVAQIQDTNEGNKSSNASETTTSTPTNNNEDILYSLLSDQQPETQPEPVSEPQQQQQQQRHYNSFSYPYTNVGLGIYASAHQHHNDVIRQHLPNSRSVSMTHQGQVIVATDNHGHQ